MRVKFHCCCCRYCCLLVGLLFVHLVEHKTSGKFTTPWANTCRSMRDVDICKLRWKRVGKHFGFLHTTGCSVTVTATADVIAAVAIAVVVVVCGITHRILGEYPNNCAWQKDNRANCLFTVSYGCYLKPNSMYHLAVVVFPFGANALFVVFLSVCEFIVSGIRNLIAVPDCSSVISLVVESYTSSLQRSYSVHRAFQCEWQIFLTSLVF